MNKVEICRYLFFDNFERDSISPWGAGSGGTASITTETKFTGGRCLKRVDTSTSSNFFVYRKYYKKGLLPDKLAERRADSGFSPDLILEVACYAPDDWCTAHQIIVGASFSTKTPISASISQKNNHWQWAVTLACAWGARLYIYDYFFRKVVDYIHKQSYYVGYLDRALGYIYNQTRYSGTSTAYIDNVSIRLASTPRPTIPPQSKVYEHIHNGKGREVGVISIGGVM